MHARAGGNAALAGGLDQFGFAALQWRHALDDAFLALDFFFGLVHVHLTCLGGHLRGQLVEQTGQPAHVFHLLELAQKVVQVEANARRHLLDHRDDVSNARDAPCMAFGIEDFQATGGMLFNKSANRSKCRVTYRCMIARPRIFPLIGLINRSKRTKMAQYFPLGDLV